MSAIVTALAKLTLIATGLSVVLFVCCLPTIEFLLLVPRARTSHNYYWITSTTLVAMIVQLVHLRLLWKSTLYLQICRMLVFPIRILVMPLVMFLVRMECVKEQSPVLHLDLGRIDASSENEEPLERLLQYFRPSIRRRYRKMEQLYRSKRIRCVSSRSETSLNLSQVLPILWQHERRCCRLDGKNIVEEFMSRFLVVTLLTHGVLDQYYNADNELVSVQLSVQQGNVLHWFMYFSTDCSSGIWYHGVLHSMVRGLNSSSSSKPIRYINGQNHKTESKLSAGFQQASYADDEILSTLYPWSFMTNLDETAVEDLKHLWSGIQVDAPVATARL
jgi:hypothetical protein